MGLAYVAKNSRHDFQDKIRNLESGAVYPLGDDFFKIDHGSDYFSFFDRLGSARTYVWTERDAVAATATGILRQVPRGSHDFLQTWYLCDLKVHPDYKGQNIPIKMLKKAFLPNFLRCQRGYAISMDSAGQRENRVAKLLKHFTWIPLRPSAKLLLWSLTKEEMARAQPLVEKFRGPVNYLSLKGKKDIILQSSRRPLPLLHVQFGPLAEKTKIIEPQPEATHMFCAVEHDSLSQHVISLGLQPSSTASIISFRMKTDWAWVLTSDI